jgi:hypothetical protein
MTSEKEPKSPPFLIAISSHLVSVRFSDIGNMYSMDGENHLSISEYHF